MNECEDCVYDRAHSNLCDTCAVDGPESHFKAEFPETEPCQNCIRLSQELIDLKKSLKDSEE